MRVGGSSHGIGASGHLGRRVRDQPCSIAAITGSSVRRAMSVLFALLVVLGDYTAMRFGLAVLALAIERAVGYPDRLRRIAGHPLGWIGRLVSTLDNYLDREADTARMRRLKGLLALALLLLVCGGLAWAIQDLVGFSAAGLALLAVLASPLLAQRGPAIHAAAIAAALKHGEVPAPASLPHPAGCDPDCRDEAATARAAIEGLASNFSDGIVAPAFWLAVGGLPGGVACKTVSIAAGVNGHRIPRHETFGWAAARLDVLLDVPASRLSALLLVAASCIVPGVSPRAAGRAVWRDAGRHTSPNAGWPQAAMGGALGLALAGPRRTGGVLVDGALMGDGGRREATAEDVRRALRLYWTADTLLIGMLATIAGLLLLA